MINFINYLSLILISLIALKSIVIGSEFNFSLWFRDGSKYLNWYLNRPKYK